jgi:succinate dehydrogenase/fumarate reductase flavoprotein subunit
MSSGYWAGEAAARYAAKLGANASKRQAGGLSRYSGIPVRPAERRGASDTSDIVKAVQDEVFPYDKNWFRSGPRLNQSLNRLHDAWNEVKAGLAAGDGNVVRVREAAAMTATARWMLTSALARSETRGMHRREDFPAQDPAQHYRLISSGLERIEVRPLPQEQQHPAVKEASL